MNMPSSSDSHLPPSKLISVPGPLVATVKALIDAYHEDHFSAMIDALQHLQQVIGDIEHPIRTRTRLKHRKKVTSATGEASSTVVAKAPEPAKTVRKVQTIVPPAAVDTDMDLVARLNRDYPAIAERYAMGEFKTVRDAAIAAGIRVE